MCQAAEPLGTDPDFKEMQTCTLSWMKVAVIDISSGVVPVIKYQID